MPEHDPNGAARRPVLRRVEWDGDAEALGMLADQGKLWVFCGEYEARGGTVGEGVAVDSAHREHGGGVYQVFDGGSWGRGYWRG